MFISEVIGNVAAEPRTQSHNGNEFTTFRVAHNDRRADSDGQRHDNVVWIDCVMNGRPRVADFIKVGSLVYVNGTTTLRVYSSKRDRCMKAGVQLSVRNVELLNTVRDEVPSRLYDEHGVEHLVGKHYFTDVHDVVLVTQQGAQFQVDDSGWVKPVPNSLPASAPVLNQPENPDDLVF